jgi:hypothetical protein
MPSALDALKLPALQPREPQAVLPSAAEVPACSSG